MKSGWREIEMKMIVMFIKKIPQSDKFVHIKLIKFETTLNI